VATSGVVAARAAPWPVDRSALAPANRRATLATGKFFCRAIHRRTDSILCIANRFRDLVPRRRDQKLLPHFGKAGTTVFAVEEVEYGRHDPTSLFELICTISSN
jgi:hypothetical protein